MVTAMSKRRFICHLDASPFRCVVLLAVNYDAAAIRSWFIEHGARASSLVPGYTERIQREIDDVRGVAGFTRAITKSESDLLIYMKADPRQSRNALETLAHELYHAVDSIAWHVDEQHGLYNASKISEPRAYLYGSLWRQAQDALWPTH